MKPIYILLILLPFLSGCHQTEMVQTSTRSPAENSRGESPSSFSPNANNSTSRTQTEIPAEPEITGNLSKNPADAEGKKLTRCEYRYLAKDGDYLSVLVDASEAKRITITEKSPSEDKPKIYTKSAPIDIKRLNEILHKLDTYGKISGPLMWVDTPERVNWAEDESTTWLIIHYEDIQYIISSRQDLPKQRYKGFYSVYTFITSYISEFHRKMRQNIGEPAPDVFKEVYGKRVKLVPGTGNTVLQGAELDYGDKKWWIEQNLVGKFESTEKSIALSQAKSEDQEVHRVSIQFDSEGHFTMIMDGNEYIGSVGEERLYRVPAEASYALRNEENDEHIKKTGSFKFDYDSGDSSTDILKRLRLDFAGEPYVEGRGYSPAMTIFLDRQ